jgi:hypothetical protein
VYDAKNLKLLTQQLQLYNKNTIMLLNIMAILELKLPIRILAKLLTNL